MIRERTVVLILGGGRGTRLFPLTQERAKPAVPFGGRYRLIDIPISNCIHSGLNRIFVLTQYASASLNRHISTTYRFDSFSRGFVDTLSAHQTFESAQWFQGTADAVRQVRPHLLSHRPERILILAGDHLYRMNYGEFLVTHDRLQADATISVTAVEEEQAESLGLLKIDSMGRVVQFREKPKGQAKDEMRIDTSLIGLPPEEAARRPYIGSMGIYVFNADTLWEALDEFPEAQDFGKEIIPALLEKKKVRVHLFDGYWEDIGTISAFFESNLALTRPDAPFPLHKAGSLIFTHPRYLPGTLIHDCHIRNSLVAEGSVLKKSTICDSVIGIRTRTQPGVEIYESLIMGGDDYQSDRDVRKDEKLGLPPIGIGEGSVIRRAIVDKNARVGAGCRLTNERGVQEEDGAFYYIREGLVVIPKDMVVPPGTVI